jgi:hypothetical protein
MTEGQVWVTIFSALVLGWHGLNCWVRVRGAEMVMDALSSVTKENPSPTLPDPGEES